MSRCLHPSGGTGKQDIFALFGCISSRLSRISGPAVFPGSNSNLNPSGDSGGGRTKVGILGGGLAGLASASFLRHDFEVLEKNDECGGLCRSLTEKGFTFDYGGGH
ncbi:MAG TPA: hypothetical protein EYP46_03795, partial [Hadesarchaea archaeon]|nr:hypothetical protein [Hadesarchaea archaeon]